MGSFQPYYCVLFKKVSDRDQDGLDLSDSSSSFLEKCEKQERNQRGMLKTQATNRFVSHRSLKGPPLLIKLDDIIHLTNKGETQDHD